mgnify:CR=1 FL=1
MTPEPSPEVSPAEPPANEPPAFEIGLYSFAEHTPDPATGGTISPAERLRNLLEEVALADEVGLDVFGLGEHHRPDYLSSAPAPILAAAAARTTRIRLTSAVTVLSSDDPVRVFQDFATLDLLSQGRAEIMVGRGSFTESFPLFGYDLRDYERLFEDKLERLLALRGGQGVNGLGVYPRPLQEPLPVWVAVGGTPKSVLRAAALGLPLALAIIGGLPEQFVPLIELYRSAAARTGRAQRPRLGVNAHGFLAPTRREALELAYPAHATMMNRIGLERGWPPLSLEQFEAATSLRGANVLGSPEQVAEKLLFQHALFDFDRFLLQLSVGTLPHRAVLRAIELLGAEVAPVVRAEVARRRA